MEIFSVLLVLCEGNPPVTCGFSSAELWFFCFDLRLNKRLSKQSRRRWFEASSHSLWHQCNVVRKRCPCQVSETNVSLYFFNWYRDYKYRIFTPWYTITAIYFVWLVPTPGICTDHSGYGLGQWEKELHRKATYHWLNPYLEWFLNQRCTYELVCTGQVSYIKLCFKSPYPSTDNWLLVAGTYVHREENIYHDDAMIWTNTLWNSKFVRICQASTHYYIPC